MRDVQTALRIEKMSELMIIHTMGFTQKSAERFFDSLIAAGVKREYRTTQASQD
jgi:hypothetical protein